MQLYVAETAVETAKKNYASASIGILVHNKNFKINKYTYAYVCIYLQVFQNTISDAPSLVLSFLL